jgi:hypothetical protein
MSRIRPQRKETPKLCSRYARALQQAAQVDAELVVLEGAKLAGAKRRRANLQRAIEVLQAEAVELNDSCLSGEIYTAQHNLGNAGRSHVPGPGREAVQAPFLQALRFLLDLQAVRYAARQTAEPAQV